MRRLPLLVVVLAAFALNACGDEGSAREGDRDPEALVARGLATDVTSGEFAMTMQLTLEGGPVGSVELELDGPFDEYNAATLPSADFAFTAELDEQAVTGKVVMLPDNAYVVVNGDPFEVGRESWTKLQRTLRDEEGPKTFEQAEVDPLEWVSDLELEGRQRLAGAQTTKVDGRLDLDAVLAGYNALGDPDARLSEDQIEGIQDAVGETDFSVSIGDDGIWRRLSTTVPFTIPEDQRALLGGIERGELQLDMELDHPNEPQRIEAPPGDPEPIANLLHELGVPADAFGIAPPAAGS